MVFIVQKPIPIGDTHGIDAAIVPPSGEIMKAFAVGADSMLIASMKSTLVPATIAVFTLNNMMVYMVPCL